MSNITQKQTTDKRSLNQMLVSAGICFAILSWGGAYVAARFLLHPDTNNFIALTPIVLATLRFSIASLFFVFPVARAVLRHQISGHQLLLLALLGQLTFTLYYWLQYIGIQQTDASIAAILGVGLIPIFTAILAPVFNEERWQVSLFGVLLLGFVGVLLIVLQQPLNITLYSGFFLGAICLISNTFFFAIYSHLSRKWMQKQDISPVVLTGSTMISGTLGLVLFSFLDPTGNHWGSVTMMNITQWVSLLFLALCCSVLAYFAYNIALSRMAASRVTVYFYIEPGVAILLGIILLGEQLNWHIIVGMVAIGVSVIMVNLMKKEKIKEE